MIMRIQYQTMWHCKNQSARALAKSRTRFSPSPHPILKHLLTTKRKKNYAALGQIIRASPNCGTTFNYQTLVAVRMQYFCSVFHLNFVFPFSSHLHVSHMLLPICNH